mmetsp:Transcript_77500/g.155327  ORF Transcript_77500/g.155327 Transcript_77500/m.155327 type:complete len:245 (-) Transcript_77500:1130-1864(-)
MPPLELTGHPNPLRDSSGAVNFPLMLRMAVATLSSVVKWRDAALASCLSVSALRICCPEDSSSLAGETSFLTALLLSSSSLLLLLLLSQLPSSAFLSTLAAALTAALWSLVDLRPIRSKCSDSSAAVVLVQVANTEAATLEAGTSSTASLPPLLTLVVSISPTASTPAFSISRRRRSAPLRRAATRLAFLSNGTRGRLANSVKATTARRACADDDASFLALNPTTAATADASATMAWRAINCAR